jgi:hypothetical protein
MRTSVSRRTALLQLLGIGFAATTSFACSTEEPLSRPLELPRQRPAGEAPEQARWVDALDALADLLVPAEIDAAQRIVVAGAREAKVDRVLDASRFAPLAVALGFVPVLPPIVTTALGATGDTFREALNVELDALAAIERPLTPFAELPGELREKIVVRALDDDELRPSILLVRAACLAAYLGGIASDVGMVAVGLPAYEDHADGLASSGYPRRVSDGALLDPEVDDLAALAADDELDDYTYNEAPLATPGDDLALVLDANGDLR